MELNDTGGRFEEKNNFMRKILLLAFIGGATSAFAQTPKKIVVEHFTNSECGICASKNPGLYNNLETQTDVLHIAIHPSAPYDFCFLNLNNVIENDDRTNYYGIYGGTPRLVIQGVVVSAAANFADPAIFSPYEGQTSPASIYINQTILDDNYVQSEIIIKTVSTHTLGELKLFAALTEDTVFYEGGNGEEEHYDVFRKSLTATSGLSVFLPETIGDSIVILTEGDLSATWDISRLNTLAILQESASKAVVQAFEETMFSDTVLVPTSINSQTLTNQLLLTPNPTSGNSLQVNFQNAEFGSIQIIDLAGRLLIKQLIQNGATINISDLAEGQYIVTVITTNAISQGQLIKVF